jgi:hypothetical protein
MVVPFGFSIGDVVASVNFLKNVFDSLSDARGARADYIELRETLDRLKKALEAANQYTTPQHEAVLQEEIGGCKECIKRFLGVFAKFELLRSDPADVSELEFALRKLQWSLREKDNV